MTSLELVRHPNPPDTVPPAWGTGRTVPFEGKELWVPRAPTWQTTGKPDQHNYSSTALKLSNVRDNDELVPRAQDIYISNKFINKSFPAEHPYSSHMEKFAMIPKFDSPQDPQRGVAARGMKPIPSEMPANAYDVTVIKKIKGFPYRHEIQALPSEGQKSALYWQGENSFDQQSKIHGNKQQFYPIPPKQMAPNLQYRPAELQLSEHSQNVLRNLERNQWIPSQKLEYTGLGPANPMALDNLDSKRYSLLNTGTPDDSLYPRSINTFDPARPLEGRLRKLFAPKPQPLAMVESGTSNNLDYRRKLTLTEREEDRLLNGKEYVNLPQESNDQLKDKRWQSLDHSFRPEPNLERIEQAQQELQGECGAEDETSEGIYLAKQKEEMNRKIQGIEAQNRWKVLEDSSPAHDIAQIREKYKLLKDKEMPSSFYHHEGKYNEERAGMYKTSYDPQRLAYSMNAQRQSGGELFNTSRSHIEASRYPTITWDENEAALNRSHTVVFKNNELSGDRPSTGDMLDPYRETIAIQREMLQPTVMNSRPQVQEGSVVLREDTYGDSYNTPKFLQENKLDRNIRIEPTDLISHQNQNLERVRERVAPRGKPKQPGKIKTVHFSDNVQINNVHQNFPVHIKDSHIEGLSCEEKDFLAEQFGNNRPTSLNFTQTHPPFDKSSPIDVTITGDVRNLKENVMPYSVSVPTVVARNKDPILKPPAVTFSRDPQWKPSPLSETVDEFRSLSTNFMPTGLANQHSAFTSHSLQFPAYNLAEKKDSRFAWLPGKGHPRPQSCLLELQDGFIKSEVRKRFHGLYPEINPEIRMNINTGKRHTFFGINAQVIHG